METSKRWWLTEKAVSLAATLPVPAPCCRTGLGVIQSKAWNPTEPATPFLQISTFQSQIILKLYYSESLSVPENTWLLIFNLREKNNLVHVYNLHNVWVHKSVQPDMTFKKSSSTRENLKTGTHSEKFHKLMTLNRQQKMSV